VVLIRLSALGDVVHTWPLAVALRDARSDLHLTWVVERPLLPLVEGHPAVDSVISVATKRWRRNLFSAATRSHIAITRTQLHELQPDLVLDPQGVFKSALVTGLSGAPVRIGLRRPWRRERLAGVAYTDTVAGHPTHRHVVATNLEFVRAVGATPPATPRPPDGRWLLDALADMPPPIPPQPGYLALLPGAGRAEKVIPEADLAAVADHVASFHGLDVRLVWGPAERHRAEAVAARTRSEVRLAPPTDLHGLALVLAGARAVVGGDTGPVHLAASFGVATLAVFTATDWRRNGPLGSRVEVITGALTGNGGPTGSSRATRPGAVTAEQIIEGLDRLLGR
jgi:lipopolysaccharide heptosyltransferase I